MLEACLRILANLKALHVSWLGRVRCKDPALEAKGDFLKQALSRIVSELCQKPEKKPPKNNNNPKAQKYEAL